MVSEPRARSQPCVCQLDGCTKSLGLCRRQRVKDDDRLRLYEIRCRAHELQRLHPARPQNPGLHAGDTAKPGKRLRHMCFQMPRHKKVSERPRPEGIRRERVVSKSRAKNAFRAVKKRSRLPGNRLRRRLKASGLMPGQRRQFQRHIPPHRLSERASPPVIQNFDPRDVDPARVLLARNHARQLRRLASVLFPERIGLHGKICSVIHLLTSPIVCRAQMPVCDFFRKKRKIAIDFFGLARYNVFLHETDLFVSVLTLLEEV